LVSRYLLDTDWIIDVLNDQQAAVDTLNALVADGLAVSILTYGELYQGAYYAYDPPAALSTLRTFLRDKDLLTVTERTVERFAVVRGQLTRPVRQQVGDLDLLIAATALEHDLTLLTRNVRDFQHIPGLKLYQPS
jgi:predicted nucleic acid-binding protein